MNDIQRFTSNTRLSGAVTCSGLVYLSGQVPGNLNAPIEQQTREVLEKIDTLLTQAGSDKGLLLSAHIWLKDIGEDFAAMNDVWEAWLPAGCAPARATLQAELARPNVRVEIMVIAALSRQ